LENLKGREIGTPRRRLEDTVRIDDTEIRWEGVFWIHVAQDRDQWWALVNTII
jgi:hypothetical protein